MKFTDTQITIDHISKIPVEAAGALKGFTTPNAIAAAIDAGILTIAKIVNLQSSLNTLQDNIDAIDPQLTAITDGIVAIDLRIDGVDVTTGALDLRLNGHDSDIITLDGRLDTHDTTLSSIAATLLTKANKTGGNTFTGHQVFQTIEPTTVDLIPGSQPTYKEGRVFYDNADKSLVYYTSNPDVSMNIGREMWVRIKNVTAETILNGQVVYIKDAADEYATVELAIASSIETSRVIGVATHDIPAGAFGFITCTGVVKGLNLAAYDDGQVLFLSATIPGSFQTTAPVSPNVNVRVGIVEYAHPLNGKLFVHPETNSIASGGILDGTSAATPNTAVIRSATGGASFVELGSTGDVTFAKTVTPQGTTGAVTIHKNAGSVNFAQNMSSVTVTNNRVTPNSIILVSKATNDNNASIGAVVAGTGSFVIYMDHNPGGECRVNFVVIN